MPAVHDLAAAAGGVVLTVVLTVGLFGALGALYFLPTIVAATGHHRNTGAIFVLNLLVGWTFIGWVIAIVWASASSGPANEGARHPCPNCAEQILVAARVCRFCGREVPFALDRPVGAARR